MFIKRKVIKTIGLFDESYFPCAGEDIDYSYRALNAGFRLVNARDVFVFHFWSKATTSRHFNNAYKNLEDIKMRAQKIFISKWGNAGRAFMESNQILRKWWISSNISSLYFVCIEENIIHGITGAHSNTIMLNCCERKAFVKLDVFWGHHRA